MNILHIIPSAFDYFNDIRSFVFSVTEQLDQFESINQEVFTLQYAVPSKKEKTELKISSPSRSFQALRSLDSLIYVLKLADIVHIHAPLLGGAKKILNSLHGKPLVVSHYRKVFLNDFFSHFIYWYNQFYLPRFFTKASFATFSEFKIRQIFKKIMHRNKIPYINIAEQRKKELLTSSLTPVQLNEECAYYAKIFLQIYQSF